MSFYLFGEINFTLFLITVALLVYLFAISKRKKSKNFPPGPFGWPIVGNYLQFASNTHVKLAKLKKKYGDIFSGRVGSMNIIVLCSAEAVKEAYNKPEFLGKTPFHGFTSFEDNSIFFSNDLKLWKEQRGFVVRNIRDLGLGKLKIEDEIQDEIHSLFRYLEDNHKAPINIANLLEQSTANNILAMVVGKRYKYQDPVLIDMLKCINEYLANLTRSGTYTTFPWIRYALPILKLLPWYKDDTRGYKMTRINFKNLLEEHKKAYDAENIRDFFDSYLQEIYKQDGKSKFSEAILLITSMEFIGAGTATTAHSLMWCIYIIAAYPDIKRKLLRDIEDVVGLTRIPSMSDQKLMPYTQAFICEVLRWVSIAPIAPLKYTTQDTTLCGYDIPKNTAVLANLWAVHHDPEVWDDPHSVKPERFLEADGKTLKKHSSYIQFSVGKRKCPGEAMAYMEIFLYIVSILQKFDINFLPGEEPTFESEYLVTSRPKTFPICLTSRQNSFSINFS